MTGAGKSTLVSLLTRFYEPTQGQILLDGVDLRDYKLADLRHQFGIVLQESVLFSTSVAENIAYARPDASEREIIEAAKAAHALRQGGLLFARIHAETDPSHPQHIAEDFGPTFARMAELGFVEKWRDRALWGHVLFQKTG